MHCPHAYGQSTPRTCYYPRMPAVASLAVAAFPVLCCRTISYLHYFITVNFTVVKFQTEKIQLIWIRVYNALFFYFCMGIVFFNAMHFDMVRKKTPLLLVFWKKPINILQSGILYMKQIYPFCYLFIRQVPPLDFLQTVYDFL